jgi:hypothetical protein
MIVEAFNQRMIGADLETMYQAAMTAGMIKGFDNHGKIHP